VGHPTPTESLRTARSRSSSSTAARRTVRSVAGPVRATTRWAESMNPRIQRIKRKRAGSGTASVHATRSASISPRWIATRGRSQPSRFPDAPNLLSEKCSTESDISRIGAKRGRPPMASPIAPAPSIGWVSPPSSRTTATRRPAFVSVNLIGLDPSAGTPEKREASRLRVGTPHLESPRCGLRAAGRRQHRLGAQGLARVYGTSVAERARARADGACGADDRDAPPSHPCASDFGNLNAVVLRTTNAASESLDPRIQRNKRMSCG